MQNQCLFMVSGQEEEACEKFTGHAMIEELPSQ